MIGHAAKSEVSMYLVAVKGFTIEGSIYQIVVSLNATQEEILSEGKPKQAQL